MTASLPGLLSSLCFFPSSSVEDDDEPKGLSSSFFFSSGVANDNECPWLVVISLVSFSSVADDSEPPWLVVISLFFSQVEQMTVSLLGLSSSLCFFSLSVKNDDEPGGSLSSVFFSLV